MIFRSIFESFNPILAVNNNKILSKTEINIVRDHSVRNKSTFFLLSCANIFSLAGVI